MVLAEPAQRARQLDAAIAALPPHQLHRSTERRNVMQPPQPPAAPDRDHPAARAASLGRVRFHRQPKPSCNLAAAVSPGGVQHVHAGHVEHRVDARAVATRLHTARRRLSHRRNLSVTVCLVASDPEGPRRGFRLPDDLPTRRWRARLDHAVVVGAGIGGLTASLVLSGVARG
jgi:hypothetical protein